MFQERGQSALLISLCSLTLNLKGRFGLTYASFFIKSWVLTWTLLVQGARNTTTHVYTQENVRHLISYAKDRGIRIIPEFDTPVRNGK